MSDWSFITNPGIKFLRRKALSSRSSRKKRLQGRDNLLQRFTKQKRRNLLAQAGPREVVVVLDGLKPNFNIGKIFRSANAFGIRKIHLIDVDLFDPAPAKGSFRQVPAVFDENFQNCHLTLAQEGYDFFVFTTVGSKSLQNVKLPKRSAFVFGHEEFGHSFSPEEFPGIHPIYIPQIGKVESLNVSIAASIAMYEYARQHPVPPSVQTPIL